MVQIEVGDNGLIHRANATGSVEEIVGQICGGICYLYQHIAGANEEVGAYFRELLSVKVATDGPAWDTDLLQYVKQDGGCSIVAILPEVGGVEEA